MSRGARHRAFLRGVLLGRLHASGVRLTVPLIRARFGVSSATAKRDLRAIHQVFPIQKGTSPRERPLMTLTTKEQ